MNYRLIACKALKPEIEFCAARSPHSIDFVWMEQGLHNTPDTLRTELQEKLNTVDQPYDAVLMGYGLCGNGLLGLSCPLPLVVPRAHDCISILLGSRRQHEEYTQNHPGSYFFSAGWIQESQMPGRDYDRQLLAEYTAKYGPDNADYLLEIEQSWRQKYKQAVFIDWNLPDKEQHIQLIKDTATYLGWDYNQTTGDPGLLQRLLSGNWDSDEFLILQPGQPIPDTLAGSCPLEGQP